jgi:DNA polymerase IV
MSHQVIAHVDVDAFFAAVEQRDHPELLGKPVVIGSDPKQGRGRGVVSTCSYEARRFGIHSAMPISQAFQLCPQAVFLPVDGKKYGQVSEEIFRVFEEFTPDIEAISIDEAFLDITGSHHLFGSPTETGMKLKKRVKELTGLTVSVGISPVKMVAKIASDYCKPDGLLEIPGDKVLDFLWPLSIRKLWGVGPKTQQALEQLGIKTVGDLARISPEVLEKNFGKSGRHLHDLANGDDPRGVEEHDEAKSVSSEFTFDQDTDSVQLVDKTLLILSEKTSRHLRKADLKGRTVTLKIRLHGFLTYTRAKTLPERTNFSDKLYLISRELFYDFYKTGMQVRLLGIKVSHFADDYVQESLFRDDQDGRKEEIHKAMDRIKDKFGEKAIHRGW